MVAAEAWESTMETTLTTKVSLVSGVSRVVLVLVLVRFHIVDLACFCRIFPYRRRHISRGRADPIDTSQSSSSVSYDPAQGCTTRITSAVNLPTGEAMRGGREIEGEAPGRVEPRVICILQVFIFFLFQVFTFFFFFFQLFTFFLHFFTFFFFFQVFTVFFLQVFIFFFIPGAHLRAR